MQLCLQNWKQLTAPRLDGPRSWVIAVAAFVSMLFSIGLSFGTVGVMTVTIGNHFTDASSSDLSWVGGLSMLLTLCGGIPSAVLHNRFGSQKLQIAGSAVVCIAIGLSSLSTKLWHMYLSYGVLAGVGLSMVFTAVSVAVEGHFDRYLHVALSLVQLGGVVGMSIFPESVRLVAIDLGLRGSLYVLCGLSFVPIILAFLYRDASSFRGAAKATAAVPSAPHGKTEPPAPVTPDIGSKNDASPAAATTTAAAAAKAAAPSQGLRMLRLLATGDTWLGLLHFFCRQYAMSAIVVLLPTLASGGGRLPVDAGSLSMTVLSAAAVAGLATTVAVGALSFDRTLLAAAACFFFGVGAMTLAPAMASIGSLYPICAFSGYWLGMTLGLFMSIVKELCGESAGLADVFGLMTFASGIGGLAGPAASGAILTKINGDTALYVTGGVAILAGIALIPLAVRRKKLQLSTADVETAAAAAATAA